MFEVMVQKEFSAANQVAGYSYDGHCDKLHGHNFVLQVYAQKEQLDDANLAIDFGDIKEQLKPILEELDHAAIHLHPDFKGQSTTVENTARYIYRRLKQSVPEVSKVILYETPTQSVTYSE